MAYGHRGAGARAEAMIAMRSRRQNRSSKADEAADVRHPEACCLSTVRTDVPDALVATAHRVASCGFERELLCPHEVVPSVPHH